jgi:hypothetical protein
LRGFVSIERLTDSPTTMDLVSAANSSHATIFGYYNEKRVADSPRSVLGPAALVDYGCVRVHPPSGLGIV